MPVPYHFDYCSFVTQPEDREHDFSKSVLSQDCFDYSVSLVFPYKFKKIIYSCSGENATDILIGIALNLWVALGDMVILTILILPI